MDQRQVWKEIGEGWKNWRSNPLDEIRYFRENFLDSPGKIIDIGGGNGRNLILFDGWDRMVCDFSDTVISSKFTNVICDMRKLPFLDGIFDAVLMVNSIHCIPSGRESALKEAFRILKPGGKILVSAWNRWEKRFFPGSIFSPDRFVPWKRKGRILKRFYHLYTKPELKREMEKAGFKVLEVFKGWDSRESWFVAGGKPF